jgi:hypothetical protein
LPGGILEPKACICGDDIVANPIPGNPNPNNRAPAGAPVGVNGPGKPGGQVATKPGQAAATALPEDEPLVPIEPTIMRKYSSHHEFPLSAMTSVLLHFLVVLTAAMFGYMIFNWSSRGDTPDLDTVEFAGGGGEGGGAGDPNAAELTGEAIVFNPTETVENFDVTDITAPPDKDDQQVIDNAKKADRQFKGIQKSGLGGDVGLGGTGTGGGRGRGHGRGIGDGIGDGVQTKRGKRMDRWAITFSYRNGEEYLQKLGNLDAILVLSEGPGKFQAIEKINDRPVKVEPKNDEYVRKINRVYWLQTDADAMAVLQHTLSLKAPPRFVWAFFPRDLEDALLAAELKKSKLTEDQLNAGGWKTTFTAEKSGGKWNVNVVEQVKEKKK